MVLNNYSLIGNFGEARFMPIERIPSGIENHVNEIDYLKNLDETDIDFIESLYRNSNPDYYLGGWIVKAVINIVLEFMCGKLPRVNGNDDNYTAFCNKVWNSNQSKLYGAFRELGLFGQEWIYVGFDQRTHLPKYRHLSKKNIVDIRYENFDDPDDMTYVRIRDTFEDYSNMGIGNESFTNTDVLQRTITYDKVFWKERNPEYDEYIRLSSLMDNKQKNKKRKAVPNQWNHYMMILKRTDTDQWTEYQPKAVNPLGIIPVVEFNQDRLSFDKAGYSDVSGSLKIAGVYHQVLEGSVNNNLYNLQPTLKFTGIQGDPLEFVRQMYGTDVSSGDVLESNGTYGVYGSYYLPEGMDVNWLTTPDHTASSQSLTEKLFYILVQVTGVPEWALGAGMNGAWATVKQQAIPLLQKVHAKRMDINDDLLKLCWVSAQVMKLHDPTGSYDFDYDAEIVWDDVLSRDTDEVLRIIDSLLGRNLITEETALSLVGVVSDPIKELELVREAKERDNEINNDIMSDANDQIESKLVDIFKRTQKGIVDNDSSTEEQKKAAGEMLSLSDSQISAILNNMLNQQLFDEV